MSDRGPRPPAILVVDDEPAVRWLIARSLQKHGFEVIQATDGLEALELLGLGRVSLVLTDVVMPDSDGVSLAAAMQLLHPTIPVIFMSGYGARLEAPLQPFFIKPLDMPSLVTAIRELTSPRAADS